MPQNIFKIYDGRTNFWQWDTGQKLIVLDDNVTEVHFANNSMSHSIQRKIYQMDGIRVCDVPNSVLQSPQNLIACAYVNQGRSLYTTKVVKFAVAKRPKPAGYIPDEGEELDYIKQRLELLESALKEIEAGQRTMRKFYSIEGAETWAEETKSSGIIVAVRINSKWVAHMVEDDYTVTPICDQNGDWSIIDTIDGGEGY